MGVILKNYFYRMNQIRENVASAKKGPYDSGEIFFESQDEDEDGGKIISERGTVGVGRFDSICSTSSEVHVMHENAVAEETTTCSEESQSEAGSCYNFCKFKWVSHISTEPLVKFACKRI